MYCFVYARAHAHVSTHTNLYFLRVDAYTHCFGDWSFLVSSFTHRNSQGFLTKKCNHRPCFVLCNIFFPSIITHGSLSFCIDARFPVAKSSRVLHLGHSSRILNSRTHELTTSESCTRDMNSRLHAGLTLAVVHNVAAKRCFDSPSVAVPQTASSP